MVDQQRENGRKEDDAKKDIFKKEETTRKPPPAGPHADPALTNDEATPGAGTLPDPESDNGGSISS